MHIPSLEDELAAIVDDAGTNVVAWCAHVREYAQKAIDRLKEADRRVLDERANAVRVCEELAAEYIAKGEEIGWKLNASGALEAADRIRAGRYVALPPVPESEVKP